LTKKLSQLKEKSGGDIFCTGKEAGIAIGYIGRDDIWGSGTPLAISV
jgi:hypothetical protein